MIPMVAVFYILLLVLTLLRIVRRFAAVFQRFPVLMQLVPSWSFFAPIPNMHDYHLVYRGFTQDQQPEQWVSAFYVADTRPFYSIVWNPSKRLNKGFLDLAHDLLKFSNEVNNKTQICLSLSYLHILKYVCALKQTKSISSIQFMILTNSKLKEYEVAFLSEVHPI